MATKTKALQIGVECLVRHTVESMERLSSRWEGGIKRTEMSQLTYTNYECDRSAYVALDCELAYMSGAFYPELDVPDMPPFPPLIY